MKISITNGDGRVTYTDSFESSVTKSADATTDTTSATSTGTDTTTSIDGVETFSDVMDRVTVADECTTVTTYKDIFKEAAETYGVDYNLLVAMAQQESGFDTNATSSSGAMGIMQLMPATAAELGVTDAYDPYENIMAGAKYIADKVNYYNGDVSLALAAYNAGSGNVEKYGGIPPFEQTINYINNITALMQNGVDVPDINYVSKDATMEEKVADAEKLLSEFSEHESYDDFINQLDAAMAEQASTRDMSDAQTAYNAYVSSAQLAIKNILAENS